MVIFIRSRSFNTVLLIYIKSQTHKYDPKNIIDSLIVLANKKKFIGVNNKPVHFRFLAYHGIKFNFPLIET